MKRVLILCLLCLPCAAQHLAFGVKGGARLTTQLEGFGESESRPYLAGPTVELILPFGLGVEFDALYSRFGYTTTSSDILGGSFTGRARANQWQFPLLLKYRLPVPLVRPYALAGWVPLHTSDIAVAGSGFQVDLYGNRTPVSSNYTLPGGTVHGLAAGGGIEIGGRHIRLAPEVRYIRWKDAYLNEYGSHGYYLQSPQNEVQLLVGLTWR